MKRFPIIDIRRPKPSSGSARKRRCDELELLCADPAARRVTGGMLPASAVSVCGFLSHPY